MSCDCVCLVQSGHPFPKCNCDATVGILAMHLPRAPCSGALPPELFNGMKKHLLAENTKPAPQSGRIQGMLPALGQTFAAASWARVREEAHTCLAAHTWPICLVSKSRMCLHFTPHHSCLHLVAVLARLPAPICDLGEKKEKRNAYGG